jgi:acid stress-induced BolA-like protein IbaG/YrbA
MDPKKVKELIKSGMSTQNVEVEGDGSHFEAVIVSDEFEGKSLIQRHQVVYKALGDAMKEDIHALYMKTYTPDQWEQFSN